jgi:hypothetical protein
MHRSVMGTVAMQFIPRCEPNNRWYDWLQAPTAIILAVGNWLRHCRSLGMLANKEADHDRNVLFTHPA